MAGLPIDNTIHHESHWYYNSKTESGPKDKFENCNKQENFFSVADFENDQLPYSCRIIPDLMKSIRNAIDRTVQISISFTSKNRPDTYPNTDVPYPFAEFKGCETVTRAGTGFLEDFYDYYQENSEAQCQINNSNAPKEASRNCCRFIMSTSTHLIYNKEEAERSIIKLHYDSEDDEERVEYLYGSDVLGDEQERCLTDYCKVICFTYDAELGNRLKRFYLNTNNNMKQPFSNWNSSTGILISHPHGKCKKISVGNINHRCLLRHPNAMSFKLSKGRYCRLPSNNDESGGEKSLFCDSQTCDTDTDTGDNDNQTNFSDNMFKNGDVCEKVLLDEDILQLTIDVKVILPTTAYYHLQRRIKDDSLHWYIFTPGTEFISAQGETIKFPSNMEFYMPNVYAAYKDDQSNNSYYLTYDMASCNGSSGARVLDVFRNTQIQSFHHRGNCTGYKISGLVRGYYFVPHVESSE